MRATIWGLAAMCLAGCVRFELFVCSEADDCVLNGLSGRCEANGYCSFPDPDCPGGFRYSEHAPPKLVHACVDAEPPGTSSDTGASGTDSGTGSADSGESGTNPACVDLDADGAGIGCDVADCDDDNPNTIDTCVYVGPGGDDLGAGTRAAPWRTFDHAVSMLAPGDSLVALDGSYAYGDAGTLHVDCEQSATFGTEAAPIFVRAEHDRQAVIDRAGFDSGVAINGCEYWRIRGFSVISVDRAVEDGGTWNSPIDIEGSREIELRQLVASHTNRYYNEHAFSVGASEDVLIEDAEVHDFFRSGFIIYRANRITLRRGYAHSHGAADLAGCPDLPDCPDPPVTGATNCPKCSAGSPDRGDASFYVEHSNDFTCENCVSEGSYRGYDVLGGTDVGGQRAGLRARLLQSISIDDDIAIEARINADDIPPAQMMVEDFVAIAPRDLGFRVSHPDALVLRNVTVLQPGRDGIAMREADSTLCTGGTCALTIDHALVLGAGEEGITIQAPLDTWSIAWANAFGSTGSDYVYPDLAGDPFDDETGNVRFSRSQAATEIGLEAQQCRVYVPVGSNMHDIAGDGVDIGGNVTDELRDGMPTGRPLWAPDGRFPCGPTPLAPAQVPGEQCPDLAARTALDSETCPAPAARN